MRARDCSVVSAVLWVFVLSIALASLPGVAAWGQAAGGTAAGNAALPADVQARMDGLRAELSAARKAGDGAREAEALDEIGALDFVVSRFGEALASYDRALAVSHASKNPQQEAAALNGMAGCYRQQGYNDKAAPIYQQALDRATAAGDAEGEAAALNGLGWTADNRGESGKALEYQTRALGAARAAGDRQLEATILRGAGMAEASAGEPEKAMAFFEQALAVERAIGDGDGTAATLNRIGLVHYRHSELEEALASYNEALPLFRAAGDRDGEADVLNNIGLIDVGQGDPRKALEYHRQALAIYGAVGDRAGRAEALSNIAFVDFNLGETREALRVYGQALALDRATGTRDSEAWALNNAGLVYASLGQPHEALDRYNRAVTMFRATGDRDGEGMALNNIGLVYSDVGEVQKALDYYGQALPIQEAIADNDDEAETLSNIGSIYGDMGKAEKALEYDNRALPVFEKVGDAVGQAETLINIGTVYVSLRDTEKALESYRAAARIYHDAKNPDGEAWSLTNMGSAWAQPGDAQKALDAYTQALPMFRSAGDRAGEARALDGMGDAWAELGERQKGLELLQESLPIAIAVNDVMLEARIFHDLLLHEQGEQPRLAIFYGKEAVNLLQRVRGNMGGLDKDLQASFAASKDNYYRDLAALLIGQRRLPEAEQVLDLLKAQEFRGYVRGGESLGAPVLDAAETQADAELRLAVGRVEALREQVAALEKRSARTAEEEKQYRELSADLETASNGAVRGYLQRLYILFGRTRAANQPGAMVRGNVEALGKLIHAAPGTVALYTVVTADRVSLIVIAPGFTVPRESMIAQADLEKKILDFREALREPGKDPRPLGEDLYKLLIEPVKDDLEHAQAHTLVWYLDDLLPYIPMAALYDGQHYLVESYSTVTLPAGPVAFDHLDGRPDLREAKALAMGISAQYDAKLPELPAVKSELDGVVEGGTAAGAHGVLPGTILLNGQFTEAAMETALTGPRAVVHIASHFFLQPGNDEASWLLLAGQKADSGGYHLTVADFSDDARLKLDSTALLTLSACNTDVPTYAADGREVDGLATTAQTKGAKAVLSSLWEVDDASTGLLMADFYRKWVKGNGAVSKSEALREAQADLLLKTGPAAGKNFSHPFYWAPFVLTGNWR